MEFCQIQLNYMDWHFQAADEKVRLLNEAGIPIWVMEPLRGGPIGQCLRRKGSGTKGHASRRIHPCVGLPLLTEHPRRNHGTVRYVQYGTA